MKEGYIPLIPTGPGVYLGEALGSVKNNATQIYCINTNTRDVEISIPPIELEEFNLVKPQPRTGKKANNESTTQSSTTNRLRDLNNLLCLDNLNSEEKNALFRIIDKFSYQFYLQGDKLGITNVTKHVINTVDDVPINKRNYRYPLIHKEVINSETKRMVEDALISPSNSPYNSPVWVVPKKPDSKGNKKWRMVIDYRALNDKTVKDAYPLPNISEIMDLLGGAKYFSVLDLASGFHQIEVEPRDRHKTAFSTSFGHYEFNRMPFGLANAPSCFQRLMDRCLSGMQGVELFVYMDDIVIFAKSLKEHNEKLEKLLGRLKTAGLVLQPDKCRFLCKEIGYLGHLISEEGIKPDPRKIAAVSQFPQPKGRKNVKQFLGLAGYYRRFIPDFAYIAKPLNALLKKNVTFVWTDEIEEAFRKLKEVLCSEPLLHYPDFSKPFVVTTDASEFAVGAVLSQGTIGNDPPIAYASRALVSAELNYTTTEKELLAIIYAIKQFRPYIFGQKFTLVTDHRPLVWLCQLKDPSVES
jgi:Reverse transcriptase (RNA-dependent DNA polymerase).